MAHHLKISIGHFSDKGRKEINQDFHGAYEPEEPHLTSKGVAFAIADGISSSNVSQIASETSVKSFLEDYYCTSEAWSVKRSATRVLMATNSWLHSQTQQSQYKYDKDRGYVCTLSAVVLKSTTAHIFHAGDARVYLIRNKNIEQLTTDHRVWISKEVSHLARGMGINPQIEFDYDAFPIEPGDIFYLATDGVYEFSSDEFILDAIEQNTDDLDAVAKAVVKEAYNNNSDDNLTAQFIRVDDLPRRNADEVYKEMTKLPFPPIMEARAKFDGYTIVRIMHSSSRSHVYLATDDETGTSVVLKTPSIDLQGDVSYLDRFLMEEWIARRIDSAHVLKPCLVTRKRNFVYIVTEYIDGQTLTQWMIDNPKPDLETVRGIVEQIAKGVRAFHRLEMLHQDLRPANIIIDHTGTVKIIDFGSTRVEGVSEINSAIHQEHLLGTAQYSAPEYMIGERGTSASDLFSLGVITYQMLTAKLPYGAQIAKIKTKAGQKKLRYHTLINDDSELPVWLDDTLKKALHPDPFKRYESLSQFTHELRHPSQEFLTRKRPSLMERDPVVFWKVISLILALVIIYMLGNNIY